MGREKAPVLYAPDSPVRLGQAAVLREGGDVALLACGMLVDAALRAAELLAAEGVQARVIDVHTLRPLDVETIAAAARETLLSSARGFDGTARTVFTAEGLFMYLPRENSLDLLREMGKVAAKGSLFAFDFLDAGACGVSRHEDIESKKVPPPPGRGVFATLGHLVAGLGEPFLDAFPSDLESQRKIAQGTGWKVKEVLDPSEIQKRFFPGGPGGERERGEVQKRRAKVPVVSRTNGFACWEKA